VGWYCVYGSVSVAQLAGCERHVTASYVRNLSTHAARYAKGQLDRCLSDAGRTAMRTLVYKTVDI
jgi:hypothetical protein